MANKTLRALIVQFNLSLSPLKLLKESRRTEKEKANPYQKDIRYNRTAQQDLFLQFSAMVLNKKKNKQ